MGLPQPWLVGITMLVVLNHHASAMAINEHISGEGFFRYVTKFGFDVASLEDPGSVILNMTVNELVLGQKIAIYDDRFRNWFAIYEDFNNCEEGETQTCMRLCEELVERANDTWFDELSPSIAVGRDLITNRALNRFGIIPPHATPYYWFVVLINCEGSGFDLHMSGSMLNPGDAWVHHFSVEQHHVLQQYIAFLLLNLVTVTAYLIGLKFYKSSDGYVRTFSAWLLTCMILQTMACFLQVVHRGQYKSDGRGVPSLQAIAELMQIAHNLSFLGLITAIAKGWKLARDTLKDKTVYFQGFLQFVLVVLYVATFAYERTARDPAEHYFKLESIPGYMITTIRGVLWLYFTWAVVRTWRREVKGTNRQRYWEKYYVGCTIWFLAFPVSILLSRFIKPYHREKTVVGVELFFDWSALAVFVYQVWPTRCRKFFRGVIVVSGGVGTTASAPPKDLASRGSVRAGQMGSINANSPYHLSNQSSVKVTNQGIVHIGSLQPEVGNHGFSEVDQQTEDAFRTVVVKDDSNRFGSPKASIKAMPAASPPQSIPQRPVTSTLFAANDVQSKRPDAELGNPEVTLHTKVKADPGLAPEQKAGVESRDLSRLATTPNTFAEPSTDVANERRTPDMLRSSNSWLNEPLATGKGPSDDLAYSTPSDPSNLTTQFTVGKPTPLAEPASLADSEPSGNTTQPSALQKPTPLPAITTASNPRSAPLKAPRLLPSLNPEATQIP